MPPWLVHGQLRSSMSSLDSSQPCRYDQR